MTSEPEPGSDWRGGVERLFRIVEMIAVLALLLAALPGWGIVPVSILALVLAAYVLRSLLGPGPYFAPGHEAALGRPLGMAVLLFLASCTIGGLLFAIFYLASRITAVLGA